MAATTTAVCPKLEDRTSFASYIQAIKSTTNGTFDLPQGCEAEVCSALYGFGNADIHGIGMLVGYFLANILGLAFAIAFKAIRRRSTPRPFVWHQYVTQGFDSFWDCAVFLAFSIQIAATIVLAELNYGVSASGLGAITAKITWSVSIIVMLPLVYAIMLPDLHQYVTSASDQQYLEPDAIIREKQEEDHSDRTPTPEVNNIEGKTRGNMRFFIFTTCWLLSIWIFFSKMISLFGPKLIGKGAHSVISPATYDKLVGPCFRGVNNLIVTEDRVMNAFSIGTSFFISLLAIWKVITFGIAQRGPDTRLGSLVKRNKNKCSHIGETFLMCIVPLLAIAQAWTILRLRDLQRSMARTSQDSYDDNSWTFGQVVAVTVFIPILVEWIQVHQVRRRLRKAQG